MDDNNIVRAPAAGNTSLDRCKSEKTVDTATMSRGGSRSSLYSRNSSRLSMGSSRSLSSKSMLASTQGSERSLGARKHDNKVNSCDSTTRPTNMACPPSERRVRKLGYSEEEKLLIEGQCTTLTKQETPRKPGRLRKMLSWVARPSSSTSTSSSDARERPRACCSDNGVVALTTSSAVTPPKARSRSAVFVRTPNGMSEGVLYR